MVLPALFADQRFRAAFDEQAGFVLAVGRSGGGRGRVERFF